MLQMGTETRDAIMFAAEGASCTSTACNTPPVLNTSHLVFHAPHGLYGRLRERG